MNNSNSVGAEISLDLTNANSEYFKVTESIGDTELQAGDTTQASVTVEMIKTPIDNDVSTTISAKLIANPIDNSTATGSDMGIKIKPSPFATDSWATIQTAVRNNNTGIYSVGDTKEVNINGVDYTVRIANKSTGEHCGDEDTAYSQTACGFVMEFVDIITRMQMRENGNNFGGYPTMLVYDYLTNTLYGELPQDLQTSIKSTRVISGYGHNGVDSANFTTNDKLYLLSGTEIYGIDEGNYHLNETASETTHQLEYYSNNGVRYNTKTRTGSNLDKAVKQYQGNNQWYWLRSAFVDNQNGFNGVSEAGHLGGRYSDYNGGVTPAFRIG